MRYSIEQKFRKYVKEKLIFHQKKDNKLLMT